MSIEAMSIVLHHSRAKGAAKLVLLGIANHEGDGGSYPAVATLARYAGVADRNVKAALRRLEGLGELRVHLNQGGGRDTPEWKRTNLYEIRLSCPPECDGSRQHRLRAPDDRVTPTSGGDAGAHAACCTS